MKYEFIGWCREDNHDKVWGVIELADYTYISFWGRRGAKLQTKLIKTSNYVITDLIYKKKHRGYNEVSKNHLDEVYPNFESDLEKTAIWASLKI